MALWTLEDISWDRFDPDLVDQDILSVLKTASIVEYNAQDYGQYLRNVFCHDEEFLAALNGWVSDEVKHGIALGRWIQKVDSKFCLEEVLKRFQSLFRVPLKATESVRGSIAGELIARCIVETGTSSFYTALKEKCREPLLKEICGKIAADEFRHYAFFYHHLKKYEERHPLTIMKKLRIALQRMQETSSDELASAYYSANISDLVAYHRHNHGRAYLDKVYGLYAPHHIHRILSMTFKAVGLSARNILIKPLGSLYFWFFFRKYSVS